MIEAKYAEKQNMANRGTFRGVLGTEVPDGASLITTRYVFALKSDKDKEGRYKAGYVAG